MARRTILCFGDSNTYGTVPLPNEGPDERFDAATRWTGVLAADLGSDWAVIEEGLGGRTTVHDDPVEGGGARNGKTYLVPCLGSHRPLDAVVLMLGTNDMKTRFSLTPLDVAWSVAALLEVIAASRSGPGGTAPKVLLMAPAPIEEIGFLGEIFAGGAAKSRQLAAKYARVAAASGAAFLDAGGVITVSPVDGVHFAADQHRLFGTAVAASVRTMFAGS